MRFEGTLAVLRVLHVLLHLLLLTLLLILSASVDQVILVGHAPFLNLLLGDHGLVYLLRFCIHLGFANLWLAIVTSIDQPFLLPLVSLYQHMIGAIEAELLKPLMHFLNFLDTQHVFTSFLIDSAYKLGIGVTSMRLSSNRETENGGKENS